LKGGGGLSKRIIDMPKLVMPFSVEYLKKSVATNMAMPHKSIEEILNTLSGKAMILAPGPSLDGYIDEIKEKQDDYKLFSVAKGTDALIEKGVTPDYVVYMDASESVIRHHLSFNPEITYLVAGQCRPEIFDQLWDAGCKKVYIWYSPMGRIDMQELANSLDARFITISVLGSSTFACFAISKYLGCETFDFYGFDCCYPSIAKHYTDGTEGLMENRDYLCLFVCPVCKQAEYVDYGEGREQERSCLDCDITTKKFITSPALVGFVEQFVQLVNFHGCADKIRVHGDNLVNAWISKKRGEDG
jgi:hypothetical protein